MQQLSQTNRVARDEGGFKLTTRLQRTSASRASNCRYTSL